MKTILFTLLIITSALGLAATPAKEKMLGKRMTPDPKMEGYAEWDSWVFMSETASGSKYFVKRSIVVPNGFDFWVKVEDQKLPECLTGPNSQVNPFVESPYAVAQRDAKRLRCERERKSAVGSSIMHLVFDCNTRKAKYLERADYSQQGDPIEAHQGKNEWVAVIPDTVIDSLMTKMCAGEK